MKVGRLPSVNTKTNFTMSLHDTPLPHPILPDTHMCTRSSSVSVSSTWTRVSGPREKGQRNEEVHHSQVSGRLLRRADEGDEEYMMGGGMTVNIFCVSQAAIKCILTVTNLCQKHTRGFASWRLAWGKRLLIASNPQDHVWDHLSALLSSSLEATGWQLMYGPYKVALLTGWISFIIYSN